MKRMLAILLTLTMLLSLAACGGKDEPSIKDNIPATKAPTEAPTEPPKDPNLGKVFNVGDYEFTYLESFIMADENGKPVVVVHFDYANHNTVKDYAFWHMHADSTVTQNGEELEYARVISSDGSINYDDTTYEKVGNGNHTQVYEAYYLVDGTSPVTMFYACLGEEGTAEFTLDLSFAEIIGEVEFPTEPEPTEPEHTHTWKINHTEVAINVGERFRLSVYCSGKGCDEVADSPWIPSAEGVVSINGRYITGVKAGKNTWLSTEWAGVTYKCRVWVRSQTNDFSEILLPL